MSMLKEVFFELDQWAQNASREYRENGLAALGKCLIQVVGQTALLEAKLNIHLAATGDVDVHKQLEHAYRVKFNELLNLRGKFLDPVGHEAWMPQETEYETIFNGRYVEGAIAKPEYVLISKALKAPQRNKVLLAEYLGSNPSDLFYELAKKYKVFLEGFVK